jgi:hypothetical protein
MDFDRFDAMLMGRLFTGGAGGFLFEIDRFALCLRINPPLRISGSSTLMDDWGY